MAKLNIIYKTNKRKIIVIDTDENDDWIRSLPGYDDLEVTEAAATLHEESTDAHDIVKD